MIGQLLDVMHQVEQLPLDTLLALIKMRFNIAFCKLVST